MASRDGPGRTAAFVLESGRFARQLRLLGRSANSNAALVCPLISLRRAQFLRNLLLLVDGKQPVAQRGAPDLDVVGNPERLLGIAGGKALVQDLPPFLPGFLLTGARQNGPRWVNLSSSSVNPATITGIGIIVLADLLDVVGRPVRARATVEHVASDGRATGGA